LNILLFFIHLALQTLISLESAKDIPVDLPEAGF